MKYITTLCETDENQQLNYIYVKNKNKRETNRRVF